MQRVLARAGSIFVAVGIAILLLVGTQQGRVVLAGDPNAGDVWTDNVGQPAGPGHEQDPHLSCTDINIWADKMADSGGTYVVSGFPPSGSKETDATGNWTYNTADGGDQVIAVINTSSLIATAQANGDAPVNKNGFHFKLVVSQDPRKSKVFWVSCAGSGGGGGGGTTPTPTPTTSPTGSVGGATPTPTPETSPSATPAPVEVSPSPSPSPSGSVLGITTSAPTPAPSGGVLGIASGGVLGISTPLTGTPVGLLGWALLLAGMVMIFGSRLGRLHRTR